MHDGMPYGRNQGQGQGHSREVDRQSPTGLILLLLVIVFVPFCFVLKPCYLPFVVQVTDADVQHLSEATVPSPDSFLTDMQKFSCIPRNINSKDTPLVRRIV